ncbi:anticodon-binding protein [Microbispora cellulosiformans]|uniref:Anticodon-binding protein n=1 Tax=Microbispora cellulosiformans TaxID=2614688 RepID=A0A5J5JTX1_9ACTN|nr:DALR anticodon-binding domain-containing protein [Microbispora cellulosiformans]KAA9374091.1 anticodon-binding protein [Microbispora cellulosiformans]
MIVRALAAVLGSPPVPQGSWEREATFASAAALRGTGEPPEETAKETAERLAGRLRAVPGVGRVDVRPNGFLVIAVTEPEDVLADVPPAEPAPREALLPATGTGPWPDFPRTWDNPGFAVRYAYARAEAVRRWARDLGVATGAGVRPGRLDGPYDRAVLRVLAELPSRRESRDPAWPVYLERLAAAYHDAFEHAAPIPRGDEEPSDVHAARVRLGEAVRAVLATGLRELGVTPPREI